MRPYNLDTSFLIDVLDGASRAEATMERLVESDEPAGVTPVAAAELQVGANLGDRAEMQAAETLLDSLLWLDLARPVAGKAGRMQAQLRTEGRPLAFTDCLIAAATEVNGGTLVTRDEDFQRIDGIDTIVF